MKVVVIGGGPAGMMAAISSARSGNEVVILEKMNMLGKKLLITGKGRCNITSSLDISEFIQNIPGNGKFLFSCFKQFDNQDIINFMEEHHVKTKEERGNRVFPVSDRSLDVLNAFLEELKSLNVQIIKNAKVTRVLTNNSQVTGVEYIVDGNLLEEKAEKVILATGGKSYPNTGSTGDGYEIAKALGHSITEIKPSLVPLVTDGSALKLCKSMQGLSLRNVGIKFVDLECNKDIYEDFGEMLFTHFGVSGPTVLSGTAHLLRYKNVDEKLKQGKIYLSIDLKPALDEEKLDARLLRDFEKNKNKEFRNSLDELLPQKMIEPFINILGINPHKKVNEITKQERQSIIKLLKSFNVQIKGFGPIEDAIITSGGVSINEINPKTMESKLISGLYFAGEIIDVDAYTGGFNLQIAYSTGYAAGQI